MKYGYKINEINLIKYVNLINTNAENLSDEYVKLTQEEYQNYMSISKANDALILDGEIIRGAKFNEILPEEELNRRIISHKTYELLVLIKEYERYSIPAIYRQLSNEEQQLLDDYIDNLFILLNNLTIDTVIPEKLDLSIKNILG